MILPNDQSKTVVPALTYTVGYMFFISGGIVMVPTGWLIPREHISSLTVLVTVLPRASERIFRKMDFLEKQFYF